MARFRGTIRGGRGEASRLGHHELNVYAGSRSGGVRVLMYSRGDHDCVKILAHGSSSNPSGLIFDGLISDLHQMFALWHRRHEFQAFVALTEGAK
jgi:hypothetical protein